MSTCHPIAARRLRESGFTIVEMMVALSISLIVLLGVAVTFVNIKQSFISQDKVTQLQDNERLAMTILTAALNEAGYFPSPQSADNTQILATTDATYGSMSAGQAIMGVAANGAVPESMSVAFAASANDGLITCQGLTLTATQIGSAASVAVRDIFYVDPTTNTLNCIAEINGSTSATAGGGTAQPLITNVSSMAVLYGIDGGSGSVTGYLTPAAVQSGSLWGSVISARITLTFVNPNASATPVQWVQTINLLNHS